MLYDEPVVGRELYDWCEEEELLEHWSMMSIIMKPQSSVIPTMLCGSRLDFWVSFMCVVSADDDDAVAVSGSGSNKELLISMWYWVDFLRYTMTVTMMMNRLIWCLVYTVDTFWNDHTKGRAHKNTGSKNA